MKLQSIKSVYFSPTGTSKAVVEGIVSGLGSNAVETVDLTKPEIRSKSLHTGADTLLIVAMPVYMGRVPALLADWLDSLQADGTPVVCVAVYGNRAYENALLELRDSLKGRGCIPIAGAAFIGEHSFSSPETPVAHGRPDAKDLQSAVEFGRRVLAKLQAAESASDILEADIPGERPYGGRTQLWDVDFIEVSDECTQCGLCADICPVNAINKDDSSQIDEVACITCCACIKNCPQQARTMKEGPVMDASHRLTNNFSEPKQPEFFL